MFLKLSKCDTFKNLFPCLEHAHFYINRAKEIVERKNHKSSETDCGFLCGNAGVYAVSTVIQKETGKVEESNKDLAKFLRGFDVCRMSQYEADEILVGRAGYLSGMYWLNQSMTPKPIHEEQILSVCSAIMQRGRHYAKSMHHPMPLMYEYYESDYLGAAHGVSSILLMLLESPWFKHEGGSFPNISETKLEDIRKSIDIFLTKQTSEGHFPTRFYDSQKCLIHWCHGAPGSIYVLAKAYLLFKDAKYLEACRKCCDIIWTKGLLKKGPGICHGVAGNGYAFLIMYRLTKDAKYLYRATKFMEFLANSEFLTKSRVPDRPYSLYEGVAGTICFLVDMLKPEHAAFPFMDIFEDKY